jgi:site-specific DNA-methyltransferase (adenine-specific)
MEFDYIEQGDCLELMKQIPDGSIDLVVTDPPYGTMKGQGSSPAAKSLGLDNCDWDIALPTGQMFEEISRVLRPNGRCVLFSQEPCTSELITDAIPSLPFSYRAIWLKNTTGNPLKCNKAMLGRYEDILIFSKIHPKHDFKGVHPLRPYFAKILDFIGFASCKDVNNALGHRRAEHTFYINSTQFSLCTEKTYRELIDKFHIDEMTGFVQFEELQKIDTEYRTDLINRMNSQHPSIFNLWEGGKSKSNVLEYPKDMDGFHPTQKPVALLEDLIKTFSNPGDVVLDFTMGSGSTCVAAVNTGRHYIGFELDSGYYDIACQRLDEAEGKIADVVL